MTENPTPPVPGAGSTHPLIFSVSSVFSVAKTFHLKSNFKYGIMRTQFNIEVENPDLSGIPVHRKG